LIQFVDTCSELQELADDALAFIIGHEITHLIEHDPERAGELQALAGDDQSDFRIRQAILHRTEYNADRRGMLMAYQAQFSPSAAVTWCSAARNQYGDIPSGSSHPTFGQRMDRLRQFLLRDIAEAHRNFKRGVTLLQQGDAARAANAFEMYLSQLPTDTEARYNLALSYFLQGIAQLPKPSWAPWELATEIAEEPLLPEPGFKGITIPGSADNWFVRARTETELLLRQDRSHAAGWRLLGDIALAYGDMTMTRKHYEQALRLRPNDAATCNNMAVVACLEKRWSEAQGLFRKCSTSDARIQAVVRRNLDKLSTKR
jgi:tetratricopeptide (TPR) repeat protein